jgi:hypothetical protein
MALGPVPGASEGMMLSRIAMRTNTYLPERKIKKSYTLSPESVVFLEELRKRRRAPSISFVLEEIVGAARREEERANIEKSVRAYYSSLSDEEMSEQGHWGEFALGEFPGEH